MTSSRSPEPEELLQVAFDHYVSDVHTCLPGRIEEYDAKTQKASVKPLIKRLTLLEDGTELLEELPIIPDVPVQFPRTASFFFTLPVRKGDLVVLHFAERSLDNWLSGKGEDTDPDEFRMHDLSDAIAVPGGYPFGVALQDVDPDRIALGKDEGGAQIHVGEDHVEVTFDGGPTVRFEGKEANAKMTVGDGAKHVPIVEALEVQYTKLKAALDLLDTHIHTTTATVGATPTVGIIGPPVPIANAPAWDKAINSTKVSIPDG